MSAVAVVMMRTKRIFAFLRERRAISPDTAIPQDEIPHANKWYFRRIVQQGAVKIHDGKCYLDEAMADDFVKTRRVRLLVLFGIAVLMYCVYALA